MTLARSLSIGFLLAALPLAACDDAGIGGDAGDDAADAPRAQYSREFVFVAADGTAAALLDFNAADAGSVVRRSARGWAEGGSGWTPLYDVTWEGPGLRRPWRLVPHGPVRLRVGLDEHLEAITIRDGDADVAALETGDFLTEWTPFHTSQLVLREATLALGTEPIRGWLIDASFGVTPQYTATGGVTFTLGPDSALPGTDSATAAPAAGPAPQDSGSDSVAYAPDDSAAPQPPIVAPAELAAGASASSVRTLRAVLFTETGAALVLGDTDTGIAAWFWSVDEELTMPEVTLTAVEGSTGSWTVEATGENPLSGRLEGLDQAPVAFAPRMVRGAFEVDGDTMQFHGVLRPLDADE